MRPRSCTRRGFLARTAACGVAAAFGYAPAGRLRAAPLGGPVGIQLYAVKDELQAHAAATLRMIREIGFGEVDSAGFAGLSAQQFRTLLDDAGLKCPSAHLQFEAGNLGAAFAEAHALGARYATSGSLRTALAATGAAHTTSLPAAAMSLDESRRTAELANRIGEQAHLANLQYVYHNHDFEFAEQDGGAVGYDLLLRYTGLVQFEIDCGWMVLGGRDPRDYFARYPGRFPMIHVKDFLPAAHASLTRAPSSATA